MRLQEHNIMGCTGDGIGCKNKERESYQRILSPRQKLRKFLITVEPGSSKLSPVTAPAAPCQPPVCPVELHVRPVEPPVHPAEGELLVEAWHRSWKPLSKMVFPLSQFWHRGPEFDPDWNRSHKATVIVVTLNVQHHALGGPSFPNHHLSTIFLSGTLTNKSLKVQLGHCFQSWSVSGGDSFDRFASVVKLDFCFRESASKDSPSENVLKAISTRRQWSMRVTMTMSLTM